MWGPKDIMSLRIEAITDTPSFCFLWCGTGQGLEWGRHCLKKWCATRGLRFAASAAQPQPHLTLTLTSPSPHPHHSPLTTQPSPLPRGFRRCEDITWIKSNRVNNRNPDFLPNRYLPHLLHLRCLLHFPYHTYSTRHGSPRDGSVVMPTSEHCLVGIKGTVRRNYDGHIIHANVDTDVMVGEEPPYGDTAKPEELYSIIEHFCNCRRRLELFGRDNNIRPGWLTLGDELSSSNHQPAAWAANFAGTVGSLHEEGDEEITLPNHLLGTTPLIESLRPKSPTQLREEAERRQNRELKRRDDEGRAAWASESAAAAAMGITLEPYVPVTMEDLPKMQTVFHEQHPFNIS